MSAKKILVVEDDESLLNALVAKLGHEGFKTLIAQNGEEGLEAISKQKPDLILLDLLMPGMGGIAMVKALKKQNNTIPVIVLTNVANSEEIANTIKDEIDDYLIKSDNTLEGIIKKVKEKLASK